jgi:hypothetical protein
LDEALRLFFAERFAPVALSGRVAVRADVSFGAIRAGDFLTSSPVPGVAMRATTAGPTLGMALEALSEGAGRVLVLVDRGWYGGEGRTLAAELAEKDREIEQLNRRLMALETRLEPDARIRDQLVAAPTSGR